jgi:hypothetical protein
VKDVEGVGGIICMEEPRKTTKSRGQGRRFSGQCLNQGPPECEAGPAFGDVVPADAAAHVEAGSVK